ncbi:MAG: hypothetical protein HY595_01170 [Candidatus Omnitrophica bacterium]|nr:hypothetical protein [Candidatus Omnitrophota bacterium]
MLPWAFAVLGTGITVCWWQARLLGDVRLHLGAFYGWFFTAFAFYLGALGLAYRAERFTLSGRQKRLSLGLIVIVAVVVRLFLLPATPTLSDDLYRYRWDGRVQQAGIDPYRYPPNAPELSSLRDEQDAHINFPHLRTVYPPLTQWAFRLGASLGDTLISQKLVFVGAELLLIGALLFILWRRGQSLLWVVAYAWHPLAILELSGSGHNDALGLAMLWLGLAAWEARWWPAAGVAWAAAFLSKFTSLVLVPWWWFRRVSRRGLILLLLLSLLPLATHPTAISALFESLGHVATRFESNASLYLGLVWITRNIVVARLLAFSLGIGFVVWWARRQADPIRYCLGVFAASALLSPVLHPWYLVWLLPCFCFWRAPALVALSGTVVLAYTVWPGYLSEGRWELPVWAHVVEYAPVVLLGGWELWRKRSELGLSFRLAMKPKHSLAS